MPSTNLDITPCGHFPFIIGRPDSRLQARHLRPLLQGRPSTRRRRHRPPRQGVRPCPRPRRGRLPQARPLHRRHQGRLAQRSAGVRHKLAHRPAGARLLQARPLLHRRHLATGPSRHAKAPSKPGLFLHAGGTNTPGSDTKPGIRSCWGTSCWPPPPPDPSLPQARVDLCAATEDKSAFCFEAARARGVVVIKKDRGDKKAKQTFGNKAIANQRKLGLEGGGT